MIGLFVKVTTTIMLLTLLSLDRPWMALLFGYGLSVPYNVIAVVGVWRSADHDQHPGARADLARGASAVLMIVFSVT
ncbi:hypothetical protein [Paracoccus liaowanqingii]|uniref:hypothetical protein n=1 Tax=Paracoccus liaowanqingii TaxID=2560053 RepID=UPI001E56BBD3|nr:hypothetical protein [Paracoccus liaowanqingii]